MKLSPDGGGDTKAQPWCILLGQKAVELLCVTSHVCKNLLGAVMHQWHDEHIVNRSANNKAFKNKNKTDSIFSNNSKGESVLYKAYIHKSRKQLVQKILCHKMTNEQHLGNIMTYLQHLTNALFQLFINNPLKVNECA